MSEIINRLVDEANAAIKEQDFNLAEEKFKLALEQSAEHVDALYGLGTVYINTGAFEEARKALASASSLEPNAPDIALNHGYALAQLGLRTPALLELQRATKFCGNDFVLCGTIAELFVGLGEASAALQLLDRLDALTPKDQIIMARAHGINNNWAESVRILHRLLTEVPEDPQVLGELATAAANLRDYRVAIDAYERLLRVIKPTSWDYVKFSDLLLLAKQPKRAQQAADLAKGAGEDSQELHIIEAKLARILGDYKKSKESADNAIKINPLNGQARFIKAELAEESECEEQFTELENAMNNSELFAQQSFHQQSMLYFAGSLYAKKLGKIDVSASCLRQANNIRMEELKRTHKVYNFENEEKRVDSIIDLYSHQELERKGANKSDNFNLTPIFIVGMPRSGTTLVEKILGRNREVQTLGEQDAMMFVAAEYEHMRARGEASKPSELSSNQWGELRQTYLDKISDVTKPIFTDKMPHNFQNVGLILKLFPEAKIIQMRRDVRDVALSIYENPFGLEHPYSCWLADTLHAAKMADSLMDHWAGLHSPQIMNVQYESLVQQPSYYGELIASFCGLKWSVDMLEPSDKDQVSYTFSELQARQPVGNTSIGRWQKYVEYFPELKELTSSN